MIRVRYLFLIFLFSCAHNSSVKIPERPYLKDQVSVKTVLMQTHAAYLRGCLVAHKNYDKGINHFEQCKNKADEYLKTDVLSIMDQ